MEKGKWFCLSIRGFLGGGWGDVYYFCFLNLILHSSIKRGTVFLFPCFRLYYNLTFHHNKKNLLAWCSILCQTGYQRGTQCVIHLCHDIEQSQCMRCFQATWSASFKEGALRETMSQSTASTQSPRIRHNQLAHPFIESYRRIPSKFRLWYTKRSAHGIFFIVEAAAITHFFMSNVQLPCSLYCMQLVSPYKNILIFFVIHSFEHTSSGQ